MHTVTGNVIRISYVCSTDQVQTTFYPLNSVAVMKSKALSGSALAFAVYTKQAFGASSRPNTLPSHAHSRAARLIELMGEQDASFGTDERMPPITFDESLLNASYAGAGLEIMMHRHLKKDDGRGLAQVCNLYA